MRVQLKYTHARRSYIYLYSNRELYIEMIEIKIKKKFV